MRNFIVGLIFGLIIGGTAIAWASASVLFDMQNRPVGVTGNPIYVTFE